MSRESTVGMTPRQAAGSGVAAGAAAVVRSLVGLRGYDFVSVSIEKRLFAPNPLAIAIRLLAGADRAAEFRVALSTERDRR